MSSTLKPAARESAVLSLFVSSIFLLSLATITTLQGAQVDGWLVLLLVSLLTALAASWSVRIRSLRIELTPTDPFVLFAVAALGIRAGAIVAAVAVVAGLIWYQRRRRLIQVVFNLGSLPLSAVLAGVVFQRLGGAPDLPARGMLGPLAAATLCYLLANTGLTSAAIALSERENFFRTWGRTAFWTAWPAATALTLAVCMLLLVEALGPWGLALALPPVLALAAIQQVSKSWLEHKPQS